MSLNLPGIYRMRNEGDYIFDNPEVTIESFNSGYEQYPLLISGFRDGKLHEGLIASVDEVIVLDNAQLAYIGNYFHWNTKSEYQFVRVLRPYCGDSGYDYDYDYWVRGSEPYDFPVYTHELKPC